MSKRSNGTVGNLVLFGLVIFGLSQCFQDGNSAPRQPSALASTPPPAITQPVGAPTTPVPAVSQPHPAPAAQQTETRYVTATSLNVRSSPSTSSSVVGSLQHREAITVIERSGAWLRIAGPRPTIAGWVHGDYTSTSRPAVVVSQPRPSPSPSYSTGGGRRYILGPRGGCYYINSNGNKTYVDRSLCW